MPLPLRYRFPIAMGLSALIITPFLVRSAESETQIASTDHPRPVVRQQNSPERIRPATTDAREVLDAPQWGQVSGQMVNLRGGAGTQYAIVATLRSGDYLRAVAKVGNWIEVDWPESAAAWISQEFVDAEGRVTGNNVRIRTAGNLNSNVLGEAKKGDVLTVLGSTGGWYRIKAPQGAKAYIFGRYLLMGVRAPAQSETIPSVATPALVPNEPAAPVETEQGEPAGIKVPEIAESKAAPVAPKVAEATTEPAKLKPADIKAVPAETETHAKPDQLAADAIVVAEMPAPTLPAMAIVEGPGIRMPNAAEARETEHNAPPILDLIERETREAPVVPPMVVEPVIVDTPAAPAETKLPEEHTAHPAPAPGKVTEVASTEAKTSPAPAGSVPTDRKAESNATRTVLPVKPPEEELWGDELPPPKRVILPPGTTRTSGDETSEATPTAPAEREGGLVMGILNDLQELPERLISNPAEVVELPAAAKPEVPQVVEKRPEPEAPAQPYVWKPRPTKTPYLPVPAMERPASVRLPHAGTSQVGPVHTTELASVEGLLEAVQGPVSGSTFAVRADDGSLWYLAPGSDAEAATMIGTRVCAVGRLGGYPNTNGDKVLDINRLDRQP